MNIWKITNLFVLLLQAVIVGLGTFYKHISFGMGLGDVIGYGIMYILFIIHIVLTINGRNKSNRFFMWLTIIFLFIVVDTCLEATIWRNTEYRWNGHLFYDNNS